MRDIKPNLKKAKGALLGLAVGDALGATLEFQPRNRVEPITDMVGGGVFHLDAGQWTDDTSMMLCLSDSLIETGGMNAFDQAARYLRWYRNGENACTGRCVGVGSTVSEAITRFERTSEICVSETSQGSAGNGSLMRVAPVALFYALQPELQAMLAAKQSSMVTHSDVRCAQACEIMTLLLHRALRAQKDQHAKAFLMETLAAYLTYSPNCHPEIRTIAEGRFVDKARENIYGTGYVIASLEAALWCFYHSESFEQGVLLAANLGDDADTTAAIFGQLAGAFYSMNGIPPKWLVQLAWNQHIEDSAVWLTQRPSQASLKAFVLASREKIQTQEFSDSALYSLADDHGLFVDYIDSYAPFREQEIGSVDVFSDWIPRASLRDCLSWLTLLFSQERFCGGVVEENIHLGTVSQWLERLDVLSLEPKSTN